MIRIPMMRRDVMRVWQDEAPAINLARAPRRVRGRLKKAEKLLRRFGVWPRRRIERAKWVEIHEQSIVRACMRQIDMIAESYGCRSVRILVGPDALRDLRQEVLEQIGPFDFRYDASLDGMKIDGAVVQYVPWMQGALVIPEVEPATNRRGLLATA